MQAGISVLFHVGDAALIISVFVANLNLFASSHTAGFRDM